MKPPLPDAPIAAWAEFYADTLGWRVHPLHYVDADGNCSCGNRGDCADDPGRRGKHPILQGWQHKATSDLSEVRKWWADGRPWNIGCVPKAEEFRLDVDPDHGGNESLDEYETRNGPLPEVPEVLTRSNGRHFFLLTDRPLRQTAGGVLGPGLDTRTDHGYTVLPPSRGYGGGYTWREGFEPWAVPMALAPQEMLQLLEDHPEERQRLEPLPDSIPSGQRNDTLFRHACAARALGFGQGMVRDFLEVANQRCDPPLDASELDTLAQQAAKYERGQPIRVEYQPPPHTDADSPGGLSEGEKDEEGEFELPPLLDLGEAFPEDPVRPKDVLGQGLLSEGDWGYLFGSRGLGKTYATLQLARAAVEGNRWLGYFDTGTPKRVAVISPELSRHWAHERLKEILGCAPRDYEHRKAFRIWTREDLQGRLDLAKPEHQRELHKRLQGEGIELAIFDPLLKLFPCVQQFDFSPVYNFFQSLPFECGTTGILVHHDNPPPGTYDKGGDEAMNYSRGDKRLADSAQFVARLLRKKQTVALRVHKASHAKDSVYRDRWYWLERLESGVLIPGEPPPDKSDERDFRHEDLQHWLASKDWECTAAEAVDFLGVCDQTARTDLRAAGMEPLRKGPGAKWGRVRV